MFKKIVLTALLFATPFVSATEKDYSFVSYTSNLDSTERLKHFMREECGGSVLLYVSNKRYPLTMKHKGDFECSNSKTGSFENPTFVKMLKDNALFVRINYVENTISVKSFEENVVEYTDYAEDLEAQLLYIAKESNENFKLHFQNHLKNKIEDLPTTEEKIKRINELKTS